MCPSTATPELHHLPGMTETQWSGFATIKASVPTITKDAVNPHFGSRYASFNTIMDAIKPVLTSCGADFLHFVKNNQLTTQLMLGGQILAESAIPMPVLDNPQKTGSCLTYFKRYNIVLILGLETEDDDDANAATAPPAQMQTPQRVPMPVPTAAQGTPMPVPSAANQAVALDQGHYFCKRCHQTDFIIVKDTKAGDPAVWCKNSQCRQEYGGFQYKVADAQVEMEAYHAERATALANQGTTPGQELPF